MEYLCSTRSGPLGRYLVFHRRHTLSLYEQQAQPTEHTLPFLRFDYMNLLDFCGKKKMYLEIQTHISWVSLRETFYT